MIENGVQPDLLLGGKYGHQMHVWDLRRRRHLQTLDLGNDQQMVLEMRPAHDPRKAYGFVGVVVSTKDLSAAVWLWHRDNGDWDVKKVIEIPAEPAEPEKLPALLKDFKAVPPLVTDINLSLDDKFLYVSCFWNGRIFAIRCVGSIQTEKDRFSAHRRHRQSRGASERSRINRSRAARKWWK
jgi:56kDa selenium binding protein (SBP56).